MAEHALLSATPKVLPIGCRLALEVLLSKLPAWVPLRAEVSCNRRPRNLGCLLLSSHPDHPQ